MAKSLPVWQQVIVGLFLASGIVAVCKRDRPPAPQQQPAASQDAARRQADEPSKSKLIEEPKPLTEPKPSSMTVAAFKAADKESQVLAVRDRWNQNANEPTLGKLVTAARATNTEIDAVAATYECTTRVVHQNKETMQVFKEMNITDAHIFAEPERSLNDAVDVCMVMMLALSKD